MAIGDYYERARDCRSSEVVRKSYDALKRESLAQLAVLLRSGMSVRPWMGNGQPYRDSAHLRAEVTQRSLLYVYMTELKGRVTDQPYRADQEFPMLEFSGFASEGVEFAYNDVFRAVHDVNGHISTGSGFSLQGELTAAVHHLTMFSATAAGAVFTETVGQTCWFYAGPHLLRTDGSLPRPDDPDYTAPRSRRYAEQKAFVFPPDQMRELSRILPHNTGRPAPAQE
ncbi:hypothetical protein [Streptomyces sp. NPDC056661]|uniref:hypothetical protein n=1 Tax=Streptomyces sp. NPDC056661 TaxID=3345898 RepID=UPI0036A5B5DB